MYGSMRDRLRTQLAEIDEAGTRKREREIASAQAA